MCWTQNGMQWDNSSTWTTSQSGMSHNPHPSILIWLLVNWQKVVDQSTRVIHGKEGECKKQANARNAVPLETTQVIQLCATTLNKDAVITTRGTSPGRNSANTFRSHPSCSTDVARGMKHHHCRRECRNWLAKVRKCQALICTIRSWCIIKEDAVAINLFRDERHDKILKVGFINISRNLVDIYFGTCIAKK